MLENVVGNVQHFSRSSSTGHQRICAMPGFACKATLIDEMEILFHGCKEGNQDTELAQENPSRREAVIGGDKGVAMIASDMILEPRYPDAKKCHRLLAPRKHQQCLKNWRIPEKQGFASKAKVILHGWKRGTSGSATKTPEDEKCDLDGPGLGTQFLFIGAILISFTCNPKWNIYNGGMLE
ncbi:hypothetical protein B9Z55_028050 [Caenorhabditis nigoni]|nr:hypothetical protein B9Z55_028050 [Caenorhabditis nigoni]